MASDNGIDARGRISIIIPTYDRASFIERALTSILNQTRVPDQIIVVDDGSQDQTADILAHYANRITIVSDGSNYGVSAARNRGLNIATGDFIAFLDSDDTLPADSIARRANALEQHPDFDIVYGDAQLVDPTGHVLCRFSQFRPHERPSGDVYYHLLQGNLAPIHTFMVRRTAQTADLRMDTSLKTLEDYQYWLTLSEECAFLYLDAILANYHIHDAMTTSLENQAMRTNRIVVQRRGTERQRFRQLTPNQQVRVYTRLGASIAAVQGDMTSARAMLAKALQLSPFYWPALFYWLIIWSGPRGVNALNQLRRFTLNRRKHSRFPTTGSA